MIDNLGYNEFGDDRVYMVLLGMFGFFSVGGWLVLEFRSRCVRR